MSEDPSADGRHILRRVRRRLIPFAFICYVVAYIDRVNIGFAANELQRDLGLSSTEYGFGAGLFFLSYCLFEIPSNLILERVGARRWIARIMIGWGLVSMGTMFITDVRSFMAARALLGIAEAGFFPGMVLYLTYWIPATDRARTGALFMMAAPVAVIVGAPVSQALLKLDGLLGLRGWQWLFLIEGLPAVVLGVLALKVLTDRPEVAAWLQEEDRDWLTKTIAEELARRQAVGHTSLRRSFASGSLWLLCGVFFMHTVVNYGVFLWLPKLMQDVSGAKGFALRYDHVGALRSGSARDVPGRPALGSDGRAQVARGDVRHSLSGRTAAGGRLARQYLVVCVELHHLADGAAIARWRVLGDAAAVSRRHRGRGRHRAHQLDRQPGWVCRSDRHRRTARPDRRLHRRAAGARRCVGDRGSSRSYAAASWRDETLK